MRRGGRGERIIELALLFVRLGATSFGGPAAHVAMMENEIVRRRKWLTEDRFLDLLGATNLIPGPNSTEMAIHIGYDRAGFSGLLVAGASFIAPAMAITWAFAWAYVRFGAVPDVSWLLYGVKPVILAVVVQALWNLSRKGVRTWAARALFAAVIVASAFGANEIALLLGAGCVVALVRAVVRRGASVQSLHLVLPALPAATGPLASAVTLPSLFGVFVKIGSVLFGSGYVLLAFLRADLVERLHWMSEGQLIDAIAVGQLTPGPVFTTATFVGYLLAGTSGALVATAGIFLPAFCFVAMSGPLVPRLRASPGAAAFLDGVNVASLALIAVVAVQLGRAAVFDVATAVLALAGAGLLWRYRLNSTWLILMGMAAGWVLHRFGFAGNPS